MTVVVTHTTPADSTFSSTGAAAWNADHTLAGVGTMAEQNANAVAITGGTINGTTIGATTPAAGTFTTLTAQTEVLKGTGQNLTLQSQTFANAAWGKSNASITSSTATAPDSTSTACTLTEDTATTLHYINQPARTIVSGTTITLSAYVKANGRNFCALYDGSVAQGKYFNITAGGGGSVLGNFISAPTSAALTYVGNDWYRISIVVTSVSQFTFGIYLSPDGTSFSYTGNGTSGINIWGAQTELGGTLNTYIPTTTTAIYGTPTLSFSGVAGLGLQSDGSLYASSAGTGAVRFYTNNIGQEQMRVSNTASAVNYHQLTGSATGSGPIHSVAGSDTNIDLNLTTKGTGAVNLNTGNGTAVRVADFGGAVVAGLGVFAGSSAQNTVYVSPYGSGAGSNLVLASKGTGFLVLATNTSNNAFATEQMRVTHTASTVNFVQVTGAATGGRPTLSAQGSDSSIGLTYVAKGTGSTSRHAFQTGSGTQFLVVDSGVGTVNTLQVYGSASGSAPVLSSQGSDTNIPLVLQPKGTGALQAQLTDSTATGGNARGANAVDWSTARATATQVASGQWSTISGGVSNTVSATASNIGGGATNAVSNTFSGIFGGQNNTNTATYSFIGGGSSNTTGTNAYQNIVGGKSNTASGFFNFVGGGFTNSGTSASAVTTQSGTMNATTAVTLSGSNANIKVGQYILGTSIAADTYVAAISGTSLTLSQAASGSSTSTLSFYTPHGVVVGGGNNQATGAYSVILGGGDAGTAANRNVASGDWSFVGGGRLNSATASGAFVGGGGVFNGAPSTNYPNTASGSSSVVVGGLTNTASQSYSSVLGGFGNTANGGGSTVIGIQATSRSIAGCFTFGGCDGAVGFTQGLSQSSFVMLGRQTTDATATVLTSTSLAASTTNQVILPNNSAYAFKGTVIANVTGGGNTKAWAIEGAIKRGANAASTALVGTPTVTSAYADAGASTWAITATADTTNGGLAITFTGQASTTIRVVAKLETTEVTF